MEKRAGIIKPSILTFPENLTVYENSSSYYWQDHGILFSISKHVQQENEEEMMGNIEELVEKFGRKKFCLVIDITNSPPSSREGRQLAAREFPKIVRAMGILTNTRLGNMMANLFLGLKPPPYPTKLFTNPDAAVQWIKPYLD